MMRGFAAVLGLLLGGCGGNANVQVNSGNVSAGSSVRVPGRSALGTLISVVFLAGVSYEDGRELPRSDPVPEPDPSRRVVEHDCTRPIEDWSANLRCR
jgi:hypothetical protein